MLTKNHQVDILVNNEPLELYDTSKLNLRLNNVLYKPEEIKTKNGEYSFSFEIPATSKNNRIFNFANNMSKLNKFNTLYDCSVNVDGMEIFKGTLRLSDTKEDTYTCNLISIKMNKVEDIFGDSVMNELAWTIPFNGTETLNDYNDDDNNYGVYFPLVCYGAFQKEPYAVYGNDYNMYTDLLQIDGWNRWYWESFHPSFNLIELVKRMFEQKGYKLSGNILNDRVLNQIYLSEYIDASQDPAYNLNNDEIGKLNIAGQFRPSSLGGRGQSRTSSRAVTVGGVTGTTQSLTTSVCNDLQYPKGRITGYNEEYDFSAAYVYDIFATPASTSDPTARHYMTALTNDYIYRKVSDSTSGFIQIPSDGLYTIELSVGVDISQVFNDNPQSTYSYRKKTFSGRTEEDDEYEEITLDASHKTFEWMPVEVQLVRNTDEPELIWTAETVLKNQTGVAAGMSQYPHESNLNAYTENRVTSRVKTSFPNNANTNFGDRYFVEKGTTIAYDPFANEGFICGFTTENQSPSVIKNGKSWNPTLTDFNQTHYRQAGYKKCIYNGSIYSETQLTDKNTNSLNCPNSDYWTQTSNTATGRVTCVVELRKNDIISLKVITKALDKFKETHATSRGTVTTEYEKGTYNPKVTYNLTITPYTDKKDQYINSDNMYYLPDDTVKQNGWGVELNLGNFLNKNEKMSDFINNFISTFNLDYNQEGTNVFINTSKTDENMVMADVDIDDRVMTREGKASRINYPGYMQVKWSIDDEEAGAYRSIDTVVHQGQNNWRDYIDRGSDKIQMDTTNDTKEESVESKFSYTWYQDFTYIDANEEQQTLTLPLIAKDEFFIAQTEEAMQNDGLSLKQRLWFRGQDTRIQFKMWNGEDVDVAIPVNEFDGIKLDFRNNNGSLIAKYFNINPNIGTNYLAIECYLTPTEFMSLKNGARVKFDDDLYIVSEIQGYDPSGVNTTELVLIKR